MRRHAGGTAVRRKERSTGREDRRLIKREKISNGRLDAGIGFRETVPGGAFGGVQGIIRAAFGCQTRLVVAGSRVLLEFAVAVAGLGLREVFAAAVAVAGVGVFQGDVAVRADAYHHGSRGWLCGGQSEQPDKGENGGEWTVTHAVNRQCLYVHVPRA